MPIKRRVVAVVHVPATLIKTKQDQTQSTDSSQAGSTLAATRSEENFLWKGGTSGVKEQLKLSET